uniref:Transposase n=1 Tax=Ditylenchus dipsaci TaxID=166011 RepID=A0A915E7B4_9BILA
MKFKKISALVAVPVSQIDVSKKHCQLSEELGRKTEKYIYDSLSFTTDIWSSTSYSFISLTAHGINQEWKRDKYVLAIRELQGSHTADVINTAIREILEEWVIKQEVCHVIVRDGAANMKKRLKVGLLFA